MIKSLITFFIIFFISITAHSAGTTYNGSNEGIALFGTKLSLESLKNLE